MKTPKKTVTIDDIPREDLIFMMRRQSALMGLIRKAARIDEDCPTSLIPDVIELHMKSLDAQRREINKLHRELKREKERD